MKRYLLAACCAAAFTSTSAQADVYLSGLFGISSPSESALDDDKAMRIGLGFELNETLAVELNYVDLGAYAMQGNELRMVESEVEAATGVGVSGLSVNSMATGLELSLVGLYPVSDALNVYGRVGIFHWEAEFETSGTVSFGGRSESFSETETFDDGTDVVVGLGASYQITPAFSLQLEWSTYATSDMDNRVVGLGARLHL